jgi:ketosteroid isomerase-like protein
MKTFAIAIALAWLSLFGASTSAGIDLKSQLDTLVAAERAFADSTAKLGIRDGFLAFLADDAMLFRPRPVEGKAWMTDHPAVAGLLSWRPAYADIASSADLGYTTGPWEYRRNGAADTNVAYGCFVTIWRKTADGTWKVAIDVGIGTPQPSLLSASKRVENTLGSEKPSSRPASPVSTLQDELMKADQDYSKASSEIGVQAACRAIAAANIRLFRDGLSPVKGPEALKTFLSTRTEKTSWKPAQAEVALGGDLGYTYGETEYAKSDTTNVKAFASYLHVWRKQADGKWRIVIDIENPIPPPAPKRKS